MPITARDITQGRQDQGSGESVIYSITTTNWASDPSSPDVVAYDITGGTETDVTSTVMPSGSASAAGDVITLPALTALTADHIYRLDVSFTVSGGEPLVLPFYVHCNAFSYIGDLSTALDKVRFHLNDTDPAGGPLPQDKNFSDTELDGLISAEGSWQRAVAAGFEMLAGAWARYPDVDDGAISLRRSNISRTYAEQAAMWRRRYGQPTGAFGTMTPTRVDGYSDDVAVDEV